MQKRTLGIAAALLTLGAAAFGQDPLGNGLPERPSVPGPHDDAVSNYNAQNNAADTSQQSLSSDLNALTADSPIARQYNAAIGEFKAGKLDDAARDLLAVLKKDPRNAPAQKVLAYTYLRQNKAAEALPYLEASVKATPKDVQTRDNLGRVYLAMKRPADAATQFKAVLALSPKDPTALQGLTPPPAQPQPAAMPMAKAQKPEKSALSAKDYAKQGADLLKAGEFDDAMVAYDKAATLDSKNADLRLYIGEQYMKAGAADKAIPEINQALTMNTKHVFEAHTMLGQLYAPTDPAKAIREFKLATDARPTDPAAWYNLGVLEAQSGDPADARQHYKKVLDLNPADATLADHAKQNLAALGK